MMEKLDFKKLNKEYYAPGTSPTLINIPAMKFIMVEGKGNPNDPEGEYKKAVELIYALSYAIKMDCKLSEQPEVSDYIVLPLEGLWWLSDQKDYDFTQKDKYCWISMIRQPDFVDDAMFAKAVATIALKKPQLEVSKAKLSTYQEGLCVQCMHLGLYDEEPATVSKINDYIEQIGRKNAIGTLSSDGKPLRHHEIYLSNPLKCKPSAMKTILRHPVM